MLRPWMCDTINKRWYSTQQPPIHPQEKLIIESGSKPIPPYLNWNGIHEKLYVEQIKRLNINIAKL